MYKLEFCQFNYLYKLRIILIIILFNVRILTWKLFLIPNIYMVYLLINKLYIPNSDISHKNYLKLIILFNTEII